MDGRWLLRNAAPQCRACNQHSGEQYRFARRLDEVHGPGAAIAVEQLSRRSTPYPMKRLENLLEFWTGRLEQLNTNNKHETK